MSQLLLRTTAHENGTGMVADYSRKKGFYWCRAGSDWTIAQWNGDSWEAVGSDFNLFDSNWTEIGEMVPPREEAA